MAARTKSNTKVADAVEEEVSTEVAASDPILEALEAASEVDATEVAEEDTTPKVKLPVSGTRIKVVELISDTTEAAAAENVRGSVFEVNEAEGTFTVLTDTAKLLTLVGGVDAWRVLPKPKVEV